jgi:hypothetical protein
MAAELFVVCSIYTYIRMTLSQLAQQGEGVQSTSTLETFKSRTYMLTTTPSFHLLVYTVSLCARDSLEMYRMYLD